MNLWFWAVLVSVVVGVGLKVLFDRLDMPEYRISLIEFVAVVALLTVIVIPVTTKVGTALARSNKLTYREYYNGYETDALSEETTCTRDGPCTHEYNCDPYEVTEVVTVPNADGKGSHTETRTHTEYHRCPDATQEFTYWVDTTLGRYTIASHIFADDPQPWRGCCVNGDVARGVPPFWQAVKDRLRLGDPGPVTAAGKKYDNFILASTRSILKAYSDDIVRLQRARLLPDHTRDFAHPIHDFYAADKVQFAGIRSDTAAWERAAMRFNAALGTELRGDLHVVVVNAAKAGDPQTYTNALEAWWQDPHHFGKNALSKNGVALVLGTDGRTVRWARAFTGMPVGNDRLEIATRSALKGLPLDPAAILGDPKAVIRGEKLDVRHGRLGAFERLVFTGPSKFTRICMVCDDPGEHGGFKYLGDEIQPSGGQKLAIALGSMFFAVLLWGLAVLTPLGDAVTLRWLVARLDKGRQA